MKPFLLLATFCSLTLAFSCVSLPAAEPEVAGTPANPTAYTALRAVQKSLGDKSLERVVEITGHEGVPQPYLWRITLKEPEGTREVEVAGGKISGQHVTAGKNTPGAGTLHLQELNLDSSGAFDAADAQARKVRVRFDAVNYTLQIGENGKPMWLLELFNQDGASIGKMRLAAINGTTASVDGRLAAIPSAAATTSLPPPSAVNPPTVVERRPPPPPAATVITPGPGSTSTTTTVTTVIGERPPPAVAVEEDDDENSGFFTRAGRTLDHTNHTVKRTVDQTNETVKRSLRRTGTTIQRFFVHHTDSDQEETQEPAR